MEKKSIHDLKEEYIATAIENDEPNNKEMQKVVDEIVKLKLQHPLSENDKLRIQKLQQKLNK